MEILKHKPCPPAIEYRKQFDSFEEAWKQCHRGDWMLWIASKLGVDKRLLVLTDGRCAATVKHLMTDNRSLDALQACEDYGNGLISDAELATADAAYAANAAAYAANAAAYAANAAKTENQRLTANICRELLTEEVFNKINNKKS